MINWAKKFLEKRSFLYFLFLYFASLGFFAVVHYTLHHLVRWFIH